MIGHTTAPDFGSGLIAFCGIFFEIGYNTVMSKKYTIWAVLVAAIIIVAFLVISVFVKTASDSGREFVEETVPEQALEVVIEDNLSSATVPAAATEAGVIPANPPVAPTIHQVIYSDGVFAPVSLVVKKGDKVTFYNVSGDFVWPASDNHPTHKNYPGSDIDKCGAEEEGRIFDACRQLLPGEDWSFIFTEAGSWGYHNHLQAREKGVIIVE